MASHVFKTGRGAHNRRSHVPPVSGPGFPTHATGFQPAHFPFQPLPAPAGPPPFRYDLSQLLDASDVDAIKKSGTLVFHTVGDTGDHRGQQQNFVAAMMTQDANGSADIKKPAFFYHLGDIVYFAGDIGLYGDNFYATYQDYPAFIVSVPGNHDCQPDDPRDGPVDPNKKSLDGWIQNFMSKDPAQPGSLKTGANRTVLDLPNVYWTFTTPLATIIGLFSNVGETEGEIHQDQVDWFRGELAAADPHLALIVAVHHPPYSGDTEHSGSTAVHKVLFDSFQAARRYPDLVLSGHVHNYQRFTQVVKGSKSKQVPCVVAGAGGFITLRPLNPVSKLPLSLPNGLSLEGYDHTNYGFLRLEVTKTTIAGTYLSDRYVPGATPSAKPADKFVVDLAKKTVKTVS
jgi:hypothetical protein